MSTRGLLGPIGLPHLLSHLGPAGLGGPHVALLGRGGAWSLSPPGSQTWLRSRLLCSLESLFDLAYSLRQKNIFL